MKKISTAHIHRLNDMENAIFSSWHFWRIPWPFCQKLFPTYCSCPISTVTIFSSVNENFICKPSVSLFNYPRKHLWNSMRKSLFHKAWASCLWETGTRIPNWVPYMERHNTITWQLTDIEPFWLIVRIIWLLPNHLRTI